MKNPTDKHIILASNSPRRRQLLGGIVSEFEIAPPRPVDETYPNSLSPEEVAPFLSQIKAKAYADLVTENTLLITADTVVILDNKILGKPQSHSQAVAMLQSLSGHTHRVVTGVTIVSSEKEITFSNTTEVTFDTLTHEEIDDYIKQFQPFDKAGSYGIQEWIGYRAIRKIDGCFYNVMGLPLNHLYLELLKV